MKLLILLSFFSLSAYSQSMPDIQKAIKSDLNDLLGDTVNEGEMEARVKGLSCQLIDSVKYPDTKLANCNVDFKVMIENNSCETSCFLVYKIKNKKIKDMARVENLADACIVNIATTDCQ